MTHSTSSARSTRCVSPAASRAAVFGSIRTSSSRSAGSPSASSRARSAARTSGSPRRQRARAPQQRAQVEAAPPHHDRRPPPHLDFYDCRASPAGELPRRIDLVRRQDVDEVVRHPRAVGGAGLRRAEVEPAVDLERVGADDLPAELRGELHRELALAGGGGADDGEDRLHGGPRVASFGAYLGSPGSSSRILPWRSNQIAISPARSVRSSRERAPRRATTSGEGW